MLRPLQLLLILLLIDSTARADALEPFTLQLNWLPQAQFIGYYVAQSLGYFEREGLEVEILPGGPGIQHAEVLRSGGADAVVEWLSTALAEREKGNPLINVAQMFQHSGLVLICHRERGVRRPQDLVGRAIGVWDNGSQVPVQNWLDEIGIGHSGGIDSVRLVEQGEVFETWSRPDVDCVSTMSYNEYWTLLEHKVPLRNITVFRFSELGGAFLEDGIYVDERRLADTDFTDRLTRFLRASLQGWDYALQRPDEAVAMLLQLYPGLHERHQQRMIDEVARLVDRDELPLGMLQIDTYDRAVAVLRMHLAEGPILRALAGRAWTHDLWSEIGPGAGSPFSVEVRYRLQQVLSAKAFYILDLIGTLAFGIAGFARAQEGRYDIWGALVLTSLPAVGGGTLRDLLVGGDRHPPFVFSDPNYLYIVIGVVLVGVLANRLIREPRPVGERFPGVLLVIDTIGLAAFCIIGAKVAIVAELDWFWIPCLAALTCAGGGVLLDVVTGREPRTFRGVIYEEIAILGGLFLFAMLYSANHVEDVGRHIVLSIVATFVLVFSLRILVVLRGWSAPRLRSAEEKG